MDEIEAWLGGDESAAGPAGRALRTLLRNLPGVVYRCRNDAPYTMEFLSGRAEEVMGYSAEQLVGGRDIDFAALIHPDDRGAVRRDVDRALGAGAAFEVRYRLTMPTGQHRWVWEQGCGVFRDDGTVEAIEGVILDITERRRLEEQLFHSQKMDAVGRLAGGVAHDFNNILTILSSSLEFLVEDLPMLGEGASDVGEMRRALARGAELTRQLLTLSRRQIVAPRVIDVNELVSSSERVLRRLAGERAQVVIRTAPRPMHVRCDPSQLEQVLFNLINNARDAITTTGTVTVAVSSRTVDEDYAAAHPQVRPGSYVVLHVSDTGKGMDATTRERIFEPFFTTKGEGDGTGLGLSLAYGVVRQAGGHVSVYSELDRGTELRIYLPRVAGQQTEEAAEPVAESRELGGRETVLVVEDEEPIRRLCARLLGSRGYTVIEAENAEEALRFASRFSGPIHLLLTDMVMPGADGLSLAEELCGRRTGLRVLLMTGYSENTLLDRAIREGIALLPKPFTPKELAVVVRQTLDRD